MKKTLICIGGGEIRAKDTLKIDEQIALMAKEKAGEKRAVSVFVGTASHDSLPYFNSFTLPHPRAPALRGSSGP